MKEWDGSKSRYRTFILRCWQENSRGVGEEKQWRFSLQEMGGGGRAGFADSSLLSEHLLRLLAGAGRDRLAPPPDS